MSDDNGKLTAAELSNFTGSEHWYRHGIVRNVLFDLCAWWQGPGSWHRDPEEDGPSGPFEITEQARPSIED